MNKVNVGVFRILLVSIGELGLNGSALLAIADAPTPTPERTAEAEPEGEPE